MLLPIRTKCFQVLKIGLFSTANSTYKNSKLVLLIILSRDVLKVANRAALRLTKNPNIKFGFIDVS